MARSSLWRRLALLWLCALLLRCGDQALGATAKAKKPDAPADNPVVAGPEGRRAFEELGAFYRDGETEPDYRRALRDLRSEDEVTRSRAGRYLLALLKQSFADESNGRGPWRRPVWWERGFASDAREFRNRLAAAFGKEARSAGALDATLWLLDEETVVTNQAEGAKVLRRIHVPQSEAIFKRLLAQPHPNGAVATGVVEEVGQRRLKALAPDILRLCTHYRTSVRAAARAAAPKLGVQKLPAFQPQEAFTPWLDAALKRIADMVYPTIPRDARWVRVRTTDRRYVPRGRTAAEFCAWLLGEDEEEYRLLDSYGWQWRMPRADTTVEPSTLLDQAKALRAELDRLEKYGPVLPLDVEEDEDDGEEELPPEAFWDDSWFDEYDHPPHRQRDSADVRTALAAAWCYVRGQRRAAALVLFPAIDHLEDDRWLVEDVRDDLADYPYDYTMTERFRRGDYEAALAYADHLSKPAFAGWVHQGWVKALAAGLARRRHEFKTLAPPEHAHWRALSKTLSRREQIQYLAERLLIMNQDQWIRRRGATSYRSGSAHIFIGPDKSEVINPFRTLVNMKLTVADLPVLVPFLADYTPMPLCCACGDVGCAVAEIVDEVAFHNLSDLGTGRGLDEAGRKAHLEKILAWCKARAHWTPQQVVVERLEKETNWLEFKELVNKAYRFREIDLLSLALGREGDFPKERRYLAELSYCIGGPRAVPQARRWLKDKETGVRFWAALILLKHGDRASLEGLAELKAILDPSKGVGWAQFALEDLLETHREKAIALACTVLQKPYFSPHNEPTLHRLFLAGRQECLDYLLRTLDSPKITGSVGGEWQGKGVTRPTGPADHVVHSILHWRTDDFQYDELAPADVRRRKRQELKAWLRQQFALIKAGKKPQMHQQASVMDLMYYWWDMRPQRNKKGAWRLLPGNPRIRQTTAIVEEPK